MNRRPGATRLAVLDRSRAAAMLALSVALGVVAQYLFVREVVGVNVLLAALLPIAIAWRHHAARPRDIWIPFGALVFAALCAVRADAPLVVFDVAAAFVLLCWSALSLRGVHVRDLPLIALLNAGLALADAIAVAATPVVRAGAPALRMLFPARGSRTLAGASGVVLAVPFVVVFGALFSSADAVFRHIVESAVDLAELRRLWGELPVRIVLAALVAWLVGGWLASLDHPAPEPATARRGAFAAEAATTMLLTIDALFVAFVVIQIAYLFGGRDTLDAAGISYSAYGRAGFFELVAVAAIVATILFILDLLIRGRGAVYILSALVLVALTAVVLASAWLRMDLYQRAYGWSGLRFYAFAGIAYVASALGVLAVAILRNEMQVTLQRLAIAGLAAAVIVNVIAPADFVARRNLERVIDPASLPADASRGLDLAYLVSLGDGAIPATFELLPLLPEPEASAVRDALRVVALQRTPVPGWKSWNLDRERARSVIVRASGAGVFIR